MLGDGILLTKNGCILQITDSLYVVFPIAISWTFERSLEVREAAGEQPRLRHGLEPGVLTVTVGDRELVE